jgi:2-methylcitrate synthase
MKTKKVGGLAGIIAGDSSICLCSADDESLLYRGYSIEELAAEASFEEVAYLLLREKLPSVSELKEYQERLRSFRELPAGVKKILETIPAATNEMDVLRTGCSALGNFEEEHLEDDPYDCADRLIAAFPSILLYWYHFHKTGKRLNLETADTTTAGYFLHQLHDHPAKDLFRRCLNTSLILYAEHEFNASTFTVKTIASTLSDFYSCIAGGIGALRGPLHGGANEWAMMLIKRFESPDEAEAGILKMLENKELIMGFGHRVYTTSDPRSKIIKEWAKELSFESSKKHLFPIAERIEEVMWREKNLFPNLDFYSALTYYYMGIHTPMFTPLFVISRITGWAAHLLEQRKNNKLIRPNSNYTGPEQRSWIPITER